MSPRILTAEQIANREARPPRNGRPTMTVNMAADVLRVTPNRVHQLCRTGQLLSYPASGGAWLVDEAAVRDRADNPPKPGRPSAKDVEQSDREARFNETARLPPATNTCAEAAAILGVSEGHVRNLFPGRVWVGDYGYVPDSAPDPKP